MLGIGFILLEKLKAEKYLNGRVVGDMAIF
jgi:hypothetical protein